MSSKVVRDTLDHYIHSAYLDAIDRTITVPEPSTGYGLVDYNFLKNPFARRKLVDSFMRGIKAKYKDIDGLLRTYVPGVSFEQFAQKAESELRADVEQNKENFKLDMFDAFRHRILRSTLETLEDKVKKR